MQLRVCVCCESDSSLVISYLLSHGLTPVHKGTHTHIHTERHAHAHSVTQYLIRDDNLSLINPETIRTSLLNCIYFVVALNNNIQSIKGQAEFDLQGQETN